MTLTMMAVDRPRAYPPRMTAFTQRFWESLATGCLETTRCENCRRWTFPPKPFCPYCWSKRVTWSELSGDGKLYAQTVVHAAPAAFRHEAPYRLGIIDLDEGLRIATRIVAEQQPALDTRIEVIVLKYHDGPLFAARPRG
jgi:uncharacterized protein